MAALTARRGQPISREPYYPENWADQSASEGASLAPAAAGRLGGGGGEGGRAPLHYYDGDNSNNAHDLMHAYSRNDHRDGGYDKEYHERNDWRDIHREDIMRRRHGGSIMKRQAFTDMNDSENAGIMGIGAGSNDKQRREKEARNAEYNAFLRNEATKMRETHTSPKRYGHDTDITDSGGLSIGIGNDYRNNQLKRERAAEYASYLRSKGDSTGRAPQSIVEDPSKALSLQIGERELGRDREIRRRQNQEEYRNLMQAKLKQERDYRAAGHISAGIVVPPSNSGGIMPAPPRTPASARLRFEYENLLSQMGPRGRNKVRFTGADEDEGRHEGRFGGMNEGIGSIDGIKDRDDFSDLDLRLQTKHGHSYDNQPTTIINGGDNRNTYRATEPPYGDVLNTGNARSNHIVKQGGYAGETSKERYARELREQMNAKKVQESHAKMSEREADKLRLQAGGTAGLGMPGQGGNPYGTTSRANQSSVVQPPSHQQQVEQAHYSMNRSGSDSGLDFYRNSMLAQQQQKQQLLQQPPTMMQDNYYGGLISSNSYNCAPGVPPMSMALPLLSNDPGYNYDHRNSVNNANNRPPPASSMNSYLRDLEAQVHAKKEREQAEKAKWAAEDLRKEAEISNYDPYGRPGCGAPLMRSNAQQSEKSNGDNKDSVDRSSINGNPYSDMRTNRAVNMQSTLDMFGGSHIDQKSRQAMSMMKQVSYQETLRLQMEEKTRRKREEEQREKDHENQELAKIEKDRLELASQYAAEEEKRRAKEEAARSENEMRAQKLKDERDVADSLRKNRYAGKRTAAKNEIENDGPPWNTVPKPIVRSNSPPVPALRDNNVDPSAVAEDAIFEQPQRDGGAPRGRDLARTPVPQQQRFTSTLIQKDAPNTLQFNSDGPSVESNNPSSTKAVIEQLHSMRAQLASQKQRVANQMRRTQEAYSHLSRRHEKHKRENAKMADDIYSMLRESVEKDKEPRRTYSPPEDVFDMIQTREVDDKRDQRIQDQVANEFNKMKYRAAGSSSLARDFIEKFPQPPRTGDDLDRQQRALLRQQEHELAVLRGDADAQSLMRELPNTNIKDATRRREQAIKDDLFNHRDAPRTLRDSVNGLRDSLKADSKFVTVDSVSSAMDESKTNIFSHFPLPHEMNATYSADFGKHDDSKKSTVKPPTPSADSIKSFNVDAVARRNEERLRQLESLNVQQSLDMDAKDSLTVLDSFLAASNAANANRPGTEGSLEGEISLKGVGTTTYF